MANLTIHLKNGNKLFYDNTLSTLTWEDGQPVVQSQVQEEGIWKNYHWEASKTGNVKKLKIQLGLSCNYSCEYCNQRFVPHSPETNKFDIQPFLEKLPTWFKPEGEVNIQFWGGEPLVYWKTLQPLAEALAQMYPQARFSMITNGSLLDHTKNEWLDRLGFSVAVSHDGPGQAVRGPEPNWEGIIDLYKRLHPQGRFSLNAMLNRQNTSRAAIEDYFARQLGTRDFVVGEGSMIDPYDQGGASMSLQGEAEAVAFRKHALDEIKVGRGRKVAVIEQKIMDFIYALQVGRPAGVLGQKCGMDRGDNLAVDLRGNVLTCQNTSAVTNHKIGHVDDLAGVNLSATSRHWTTRADCPSCPVLQLCSGGCMFLEGDLWEKGCDNAFSDNIVFFAAAIEMLTGSVPVRIEGSSRPDREYIFEVRTPTKTIIPIKEVK